MRTYLKAFALCLVFALAACTNPQKTVETEPTKGKWTGYLDDIQRYAATHTKEEAMRYAIRKHIAWIIEHSPTRLRYHGEPLPEVRYATSEVMASLLGSQTRGIQLYGLYSYDHKVIYMLPGFKHDYLFSPFLVHEVGHFLQDINGLRDRYECYEAREGLPFALQYEWHREFVHGPFPYFYFKVHVLNERTRCT